jgi:hypothetical protein
VWLVLLEIQEGSWWRDPNKFLLTPTLCIGGIMLKGISLEKKQDICLLNVYGPCVERKFFGTVWLGVVFWILRI